MDSLPTEVSGKPNPLAKESKLFVGFFLKIVHTHWHFENSRNMPQYGSSGVFAHEEEVKALELYEELSFMRLGPHPRCTF